MRALEDQIIEEQLVKTGNRPNEYVIKTTPLQEVKLQYFLDTYNLDSPQEYFNINLTELFRLAIIKKIEDESATTLQRKVQKIAPELQKIREVFSDPNE